MLVSFEEFINKKPLSYFASALIVSDGKDAGESSTQAQSSLNSDILASQDPETFLEAPISNDDGGIRIDDRRLESEVIMETFCLFIWSSKVCLFDFLFEVFCGLMWSEFWLGSAC